MRPIKTLAPGLSITRRRMLGYLLLSAGSVLTF